MTLTNAKNAGYLNALERGRFKLNPVGHNLVAHKLPSRDAEDTAEPRRMVETFLIDSWLEHLRQHERVTNADRALQDVVYKFHTRGAPKVTHLIAASVSTR
jgi:Transmembrane secretion effector